MLVKDQHFVLLSMCPEATRSEVLKDYSAKKYPTYESLKQEIENLLNRDKDLKKTSKGIDEVGVKKEETAASTTEATGRGTGERGKQMHRSMANNSSSKRGASKRGVFTR